MIFAFNFFYSVLLISNTQNNIEVFYNIIVKRVPLFCDENIVTLYFELFGLIMITHLSVLAKNFWPSCRNPPHLSGVGTGIKRHRNVPPMAGFFFLNVVKEDMQEVGAKETDVEDRKMGRMMIRCVHP